MYRYSTLIFVQNYGRVFSWPVINIPYSIPSVLPVVFSRLLHEKYTNGSVFLFLYFCFVLFFVYKQGEVGKTTFASDIYHIFNNGPPKCNIEEKLQTTHTCVYVTCLPSAIQVQNGVHTEALICYKSTSIKPPCYICAHVVYRCEDYISSS